MNVTSTGRDRRGAASRRGGAVARCFGVIAAVIASIGHVQVVAAQSTGQIAACIAAGVVSQLEAPAADAVPMPHTVPAARLALLAKGVNLSHWFWMSEGRNAEKFFTAEDAAMLRRAGIFHVRLPIEPDLVWDHENATPRPAGMIDVQAGVRLLLDAGLAVVIDVHPARSTWARPDANWRSGERGYAAELARFWRFFAKQFAESDPERVFLEILNEPTGLKDESEWARVQEELATIIRAEAPHHTIIATGDNWGGIQGLMKLKPLADTNVIYSFHFYEPHNFTHQGATWGWEGWKSIANLPYPATPDMVKPIAAGIKDDKARYAVVMYGDELWNGDEIRKRLGDAAAWSKKHGRPVYCGEFGVYRKVAPAESRAAWLRDTANALNELGIGWAMWDYAGGFAITNGEPGARTLDSATVNALGLKVDAGADGAK
jgi:endoglucanase